MAKIRSIIKIVIEVFSYHLSSFFGNKQNSYSYLMYVIRDSDIIGVSLHSNVIRMRKILF